MRVISLLPGATGSIVALGGSELLVGISHACDPPGGLAALPRVTAPAIDPSGASGAIDSAVRSLAAAGQPLFTLDEPLIRSLAPDLIITQALCAVCAVSEADVRALATRLPGPPRVVSVSGSTLDGVFADIITIASAIGLADEAAELVPGLRRRVRAVHDRLKAARARRPRVAVIEWSDPVFGAGHWVPEQVARAGGIDVLAAAGGHSVVVDANRFRDARPEFVIVAPCGVGIDRAVAEAEWLRDAHPWLEQTAVWALDADRLTSRPGPNLVDGIETLASILSPPLFTPPRPDRARPVLRSQR